MLSVVRGKRSHARALGEGLGEGVSGPYSLCLLRQALNPVTIAAASSKSVPGSGTAATAAYPATGEPVAIGSKMNVPPLPTVRLVPVGKAAAAVMASVPASTMVPPP